MRRVNTAKRRAPRSATMPRRRLRVIFGAATLGLVLMTGALSWAWNEGRVAAIHGDLRAALFDFSAAAGLAIGEVFVIGREKTSRQTLVEALDVTIGAPILAFDTEAARRRIEAIGWVREAIVERRLPDIIFLHIKEHKPLALWQRAGRLVVINRDGAVIDGALPVRFSRLLVIVGDDAPVHVGRLLAVLAAEPGLSRRVAAAVRVGGRRWNLRFDNGVDAAFPEDGFSAAWRRLAKLERHHQLLTQDITGIDLRLSDRVVVRPAEAFKIRRAEGENT